MRPCRRPGNATTLRRSSCTARSWLAARRRGPDAPGRGAAARPVARLPGAGRGREPARSDRRRTSSSPASPVRPFSPWTDRLERRPPAPPLRHVARGAGARPRRRGRIASRSSSRRSAGTSPRSLAAAAARSGRGRAHLAELGRSDAPGRGCPGWRRELLELADALLPNSRAEARQLVRLFGADRARIHVVPNGVEPRFATATADLFRRTLRSARTSSSTSAGSSRERTCSGSSSRGPRGRSVPRRDRRRPAGPRALPARLPLRRRGPGRVAGWFPA